MLGLEHYGVIAIIMMTMLAVGYGMSTQYNNDVRTAGSFMILGGIIAGLVIAGGVAYELQKRLREWNLDRRLDELEIKERELKVKKREKEFRKKAGVEEYINSQDERHEKNSDFGAPVSENTREAQNKTSQSPQSTINKPQKEESEEELILKTGRPVSKNLYETGEPLSEKMEKKDEPDFTEKDPSSIRKDDFVEKENVVHSTEKTPSEEEYRIKIMEDKYLKYLWTLYQTPGHIFPYENRLIKEAQGNTHNRSRAYDAFKTLEQYGLIKFIQKTKFDGKVDRTSKGVELTPIGLALMEKAEKESVTTWNDFLEKYKLEPKSKK